MEMPFIYISERWLWHTPLTLITKLMWMAKDILSAYTDYSMPQQNKNLNKLDI
jgi:hypothetical protein